MKACSCSGDRSVGRRRAIRVRWCPSWTCTTFANGWRPWPSPCTYDATGSRYARSASAWRASTRSRAGDRGRAARGQLVAAIDRAAQPASGVTGASAGQRRHHHLPHARRPAYLDPSTTPTRPLPLFAFGSARRQPAGVARAHDTARGWLDLVGTVVARAARGHAAACEGADADRTRPPTPRSASGRRSRSTRRQRRRPLRGDQGAALPRGTPSQSDTAGRRLAGDPIPEVLMIP